MAFVVYYGLGAIPSWNDPERSFPLMLVVLLAACGFRLALLLASDGRKEDVFGGAMDKHARFRQPSHWYIDILGVWWTVGVVVTVLFLASLDEFPLFSLNMEQSRQVANNMVSGWLRFAPYSLIPAFFLTVVFWIRGFLPGLVPLLGLSFLVGVFLLLGNRAPLLAVLSGAALLLLWSHEHLVPLRFRWAFLGVGLLLALGLFGMVGAYRVSHDEGLIAYPEHQGSTLSLAGREISHYLGHASVNTMIVLENVPYRYPFRYGGSYLDPLKTILPGKQFTVDQQLKQALGLNFPGGGLVPSFLGEAYLNGSYLGVFLAPLLVTLSLLALLDHAKRSLALLALLMYAGFHLSALMVTGLLVSNVLPFFALLSLGILALLERKAFWMKRDDD